MHYTISDIEGSVLDTFSDRRPAFEALRAMILEDGSMAHELLLLSFNDEGEPAGPAQTYGDLLATGLEPVAWIWSSVTTANSVAGGVSRLPSRAFRPQRSGSVAPTPLQGHRILSRGGWAVQRSDETPSQAMNRLTAEVAAGVAQQLPPQGIPGQGRAHAD